jgi:hypothetical protein
MHSGTAQNSTVRIRNFDFPVGYRCPRVAHSPHTYELVPQAMSGQGVAGVGMLKCANDGCTEPGLHLCARCRGVKYCSAACQKVHWKQGGHKQKCHVSPIAAATATRLAPAAKSHRSSMGGAGSEEDTCTICLCGDPPPIQSGCACRGDAGLAHVECRAEDAAHRMANSNDRAGWAECMTCKQPFTGTMMMGLAEAWWSRVKHMPEGKELRLTAGNHLANELDNQGRMVEAEAMYRDVLRVLRRR